MKSNNSKTKLIYLQPNGGLANRMRVVAAGLWIQKMFNLDVFCFWEKNTSLGAQFHDLFEDISEIQFIPRKGVHKYIKDPSRLIWWQKYLIQITNRLQGIDMIVNDKYITDNIHPRKAEIFDIIKKNRRVYFSTCHEFGGDFQEINRFVPVQNIREKIDQVCNQFTDQTVGIHIRRTDNKLSIENSPVDVFEKQMKILIAHDDRIRFFLSTDDYIVENYLLDKFGNKIIKHTKELSRQTISGMQDAVVDMFCLSKTSRIFGSYWSSFNHMAARIGNIKIIQLTKDC